MVYPHTGAPGRQACPGPACEMCTLGSLNPGVWGQGFTEPPSLFRQQATTVYAGVSGNHLCRVLPPGLGGRQAALRPPTFMLVI